MAVFHELWLDEHRQARLNEAIDSVTATEGAIIEVGCWEGNSTSIIANRFAPAVVHCVDHWLGDLTDPNSPVASLAKERDVFSTFCANMEELTEGNYEVHRGDWRVMLGMWKQPVRFIFIDAQHTYAEVFDNIEWAKKRMTSGGVIAGDDGDFPAVSMAVQDTLGFSPSEAVWWMRLGDWRCEECHRPWIEGQQQCRRCGNRTREQR